MMLKPRKHSRRAIGAAAAIPLVASVTVAAAAATPASAQQPDLESRVTQIISSDGLNFRDLNQDGYVNTYEDWRRPVEERVADLVGRMTLEEKAGLMLIDTFNALCEGGVNEEMSQNYQGVQKMHRFIFRNSLQAPGQATCTDGGSGGRNSSQVTPNEAASFLNAIQERSEESRLGIPALFKSNARNHIDPDARFGINTGAGTQSPFPKEAGIAAAALGSQAAKGEAPTTGDMSVVHDFADVMAQEWRAFGLRGMYGYMADLSTEPRWYRTHETFTEDADFMANIATTLVETLQGPVDEHGDSLTPQSAVALTMKHFPGGGPQELGFDPHYSFGKTQVYPNEGFGYNLRPFAAAIDAGVSSIMPYYGAPIDASYEGVEYPETGFAFSDEIINGLLRDQLGFRGYVNSDTGIINSRAWGLEQNTVPERVAAAINGGTDTLSGFNEASVILDLVDQGLVSEERVDLAATRLLTPMFQMGLFENPYVDETAANDIVGNADFREVAEQVQRDSLVLLENKAATDGDTVLPLRDDATIYTLGSFDPAEFERRGYTVIEGNTEDPADRPSAERADVVLVNLTSYNVGAGDYRSNDPETGLNPDHINPIVMPGTPGLDGNTPYGGADACVWQGAESCTDDGLVFGGSFPWEGDLLDFTGMDGAQSWEVSPSLETIRTVMEEVGDPKKVVLNTYFRQPFVLDEESGLRGAGAILANFGVETGPLLDVLSGEQDFQGRLPFALAGTRLAIQEQYSDTPGYEETTDGALFPFGFGLSYSDGATDLTRPQPTGDIPVEAIIPGDGGDPTDPTEPGALVLSVQDATLTLGEARNRGDHLSLSGVLPTVSVTDSRSNANGWSVTGQSSDLHSQTNATVRADHLGWQPYLLSGEATPGSDIRSVLRNGTGLAQPATLGTGHTRGTADLAADVNLEVPVTTTGGTYRGGVTLSLFPQD